MSKEELQISNTERKKVTVRPTIKSLKLRSSNTCEVHKYDWKPSCLVCGKLRNSNTVLLNDFSDIMDLYFNERLFQFGHDDPKLIGFTQLFFDRLQLFFRGVDN